MENKLAVVAIIVENPDSVRALNETLHEYSSYIIGRMGIPYRAKQLSLISIALDAPEKVIHALKRRLVEHDGVRAEIVEA
ncbi:MAG: iron-only hydrogenase system regulator [Solobacterium sp.]|nr:iron-only hydrogenase system regulator [Solobacterium sp.]MBR0478895.1 iron-only hydrogenase system regulator [Solobacterium sp.]